MHARDAGDNAHETDRLPKNFTKGENESISKCLSSAAVEGAGSLTWCEYVPLGPRKASSGFILVVEGDREEVEPKVVMVSVIGGGGYEGRVGAL